MNHETVRPRTTTPSPMWPQRKGGYPWPRFLERWIRRLAARGSVSQDTT